MKPLRVLPWSHVHSKVCQTEKYFSATSMDRENFARFQYQNFDFQQFQGAAGIGPYMTLLTDEEEQRGSSFNYYVSLIFPSQIINEEPSSRSISPEPTSSIADASAAAAQKKKQCETLTREEEKYLVNLWVEYYDRLESKDSRKYWDIITRELNEKFGKNRSVDNCKRKIKYLVERYKEKNDCNSGSLWKSPFYNELDAVLGNRDVVTFQHVAQAGSLFTGSSSSSAVKTSNPPSSAEDSPPLKERNSKANDDGNVAVASKHLRRQHKKRRAPTAEQQGQELDKESQVQAKILIKSVTEQGARMTEAIKKMQDSHKQQMEMVTQFMVAMISMMQNNATN